MDEGAWIERARQGDEGAFQFLMERYQSLVYNVAYRILGDVDAAADATQEAFWSAYRGLKRFRGGSFRSWLLRIVTNACYDQLRAKKRRPAHSLDALLEEDPHTFLLRDGADGPEDLMERVELGEVLQAAIEHLPVHQRVVVLLVDMQGLDYKEAAEALGISVGTVKSRLSRARARLRDWLLEREELLPLRYRLHHKGVGGGVGRWLVEVFAWVGHRWLK